MGTLECGAVVATPVRTFLGGVWALQAPVANDSVNDAPIVRPPFDEDRIIVVVPGVPHKRGHGLASQTAPRTHKRGIRAVCRNRKNCGFRCELVLPWFGSTPHPNPVSLQYRTTRCGSITSPAPRSFMGTASARSQQRHLTGCRKSPSAPEKTQHTYAPFPPHHARLPPPTQIVSYVLVWLQRRQRHRSPVTRTCTIATIHHGAAENTTPTPPNPNPPPEEGPDVPRASTQTTGPRDARHQRKMTGRT